MPALHVHRAASNGLPTCHARTAFHPEVGEVTLEGLVRTYAEHGAHHVAQIVQARG